MDLLHSVLIIGGNSQSQEQKLAEILKKFGAENKTNNPNLVRILPDEDKIGIGIDKVRQLRLILSIKSVNKQPKVAIIHSAETVTTKAQNALLKTLEEPPENTFLILLARNADSLLPTITSRCQLVELPENLQPEPPAGQLKKLFSILDLIGQGNIPAGFAWAKEKSLDRQSALAIIDDLLIVGRHLLLSQKVDSMIIHRLFEAKKYLLGNCNTRLTLENLFLE